jgi:hypothetical protein
MLCVVGMGEGGDGPREVGGFIKVDILDRVGSSLSVLLGGGLLIGVKERPTHRVKDRVGRSSGGGILKVRGRG